MSAALKEQSEQIIDRYAIYDKIAAGGMAVVHLGRLLGQAGFSRTVAIKRLHPQFATDAEFVAMFLDEAHLAGRVQHPNVVAPLDVVVTDGELLVVMEYISGETLGALMRVVTSAGPVPGSVPVLSSILVGTLYGLHAAHEALGENGQPLNIVHRDVSPQNIIVGLDGIPRVLDFGVAKAAMRSHATKQGEVKGKVAYMPPEQLRGAPVDRRADVFAAGIVFWEVLTGRRLFRGDDLGQTVERVLYSEIPPPSSYNSAVSPRLDQVVAKSLRRDPSQRYATAKEFAVAIEHATLLGSVSEVADWVKTVGGAPLAQRVGLVLAIENHSSNRLRIGGRSMMQTPSSIEVDHSSGRLSSQDSAPVSERAPESAKQLRVPNIKLLAGVVVLGIAIGAAALPISRSVSGAASGRPTRPAAGTSVHAGSVRPPSVVAPLASAPTAHALQPEPNPALTVQGSVSKPSQDRAQSSPSAKRSNSSKPSSAAKLGSAQSVTKRADCDPPFVVDANGIRRIKRGCI